MRSKYARCYPSCGLYVAGLFGIREPECAERPPAIPVNVLTFHNNNGRLGLNSQETTLTPANVNPTTFGKVGFLATDGQVYGQPLFVSNVTVNGSIHNVVYVVTEHDTVFAFDADTGAKLWRTAALPPGETPGNDPNCGLVKPEIGITSTPIDRPDDGGAWVDLSGHLVAGLEQGMASAAACSRPCDGLRVPRRSGGVHRHVPRNRGW